MNLTSLDNLSGSINCSGLASLTAWGSASGLGVNGDEGINLTVIGLGGGYLASNDGTIHITAAGIASFGYLQAGGDIDITALSTLNLADATANGNVNIVAGGTITGIIAAGENATVQSLDAMEAQVTAGNDATIGAVTGIQAYVTAGNNLSAVSYGDINSWGYSLEAGNEVTQVWARGNIGGAIVAGGAMGDITSYDWISAYIQAGGAIDGVSAWGYIVGAVYAPVVTWGVAGGQWVDIVTESFVRETPYDTALLAGESYPADPDTSLGEVQAAVNEGLNQVIAFEQTLIAQQTASTNQRTALAAQSQGQLSQLQSDVGMSLEEAQASVWQTNQETEQTLGGAQSEDADSLLSAQEEIEESSLSLTAQMGEQGQLAQASLEQANSAVLADQARLQGIATQQQTDMTAMLAQETSNRNAAATQLAEIQAQRPGQFYTTSNQMFSDLAHTIWMNNPEAQAFIHAALTSISTVGNFLGPAGFLAGRVADVLNAGLYYLEGNNLAAIGSGISALPLAGELFGSAEEAASLGEGLTASATADANAADEALAVGEEAGSGASESLGETALQEEGGCANGEGCFVAGTEVELSYNAPTGTYTYTAIQDLYIGEQVVSRNQDDPNAPLEMETVTAVEQHFVYDLHDVTIEGSDGSIETIQAADEYPFYVEGLGWTDAQYLIVGEQLQQSDGSYATLVSNTDAPPIERRNGLQFYRCE